MNKKEIMDAIEKEIVQFGADLIRLTVTDVRELYAVEVGKYGPGRDAFQGLRTEVSAALQRKNAPPHTHDPAAAAKPLTQEEHDALHDASRAGVSDAHRLLADHARRVDPWPKDAHHFVQKWHGMALWREVDRVIAEAGIRPTGGAA